MVKTGSFLLALTGFSWLSVQAQTPGELAQHVMPEEDDLARRLLTDLLGPVVDWAAAGDGMSDALAVLTTMVLAPYSVLVFALAVLVVIYQLIVAAIDTAHGKRFLGQRQDKAYFALRVGLVICLLVPWSAAPLNGMNGIQALTVWASLLGSGGGNKTLETALVETVKLPFLGETPGAIARPQASTIAAKVLDNETCMAVMNHDLAAAGRSPMAVTTMIVAPQDPGHKGFLLEGLVGPMDTPYAPSEHGAQYNDLIQAAAAEHGVDPALIHAVIQNESNYNRFAVSSAGAMGLMQLMPGTAAELGVTDPFDPAQNINGGTQYLAQMLDRYNGDTALALAAYNAGPGRVDDYLQDGRPLPAETVAYIENVVNDFDHNWTGGSPGEIAGKYLQVYRWGGGGYAANECGEFAIPIRAVASNKSRVTEPTVIHNEIARRHIEAFEKLIVDLRRIANLRALAQRGRHVGEPPADWYTDAIRDYAFATVTAAREAYENRYDQFRGSWREYALRDGWIVAGSWFYQLADMSQQMNDAISAYTHDVAENGARLQYAGRDNQAMVNSAVERNRAMRDSIYQQSGLQTYASRIAQDGWVSSWTYGIAQTFIDADAAGQFPLLHYGDIGRSLLVWSGIGGIIGSATTTLSAGRKMPAGVGAGLKAAGWAAWILVVIGFVMGYVIPALPMVFWTIGVVGWFRHILIGLAAAPMWLLMHLLGHNQSLATHWTYQGYFRLARLLLQPTLMVIGLIFAIGLIWIVHVLLIQTLFATMVIYSSGSATMMAFALLVYAALILTTVTTALSLILVLPYAAFRWLDHVSAGSGELSAANEARNRLWPTRVFQ